MSAANKIKMNVALLAILIVPAISHAGGAFMFGAENEAAGIPTPSATPPATPAPAPLTALPTPGPVPPTRPKIASPKVGSDTNQLLATSRIFLRSAPGEKSRKLGLIESGTVLDPTGRERGGWSEVEVRGRKGWVNSDYVTEGTYCPDGKCEKAGGFTAIVESLVDVVRNSSIGSNGPLSYADRLQRYFRVGYGAGRNLCWRAVWNTLRAAGMVRGDLTQNSAKNALIDLGKQGFKHDPTACNRPGVVRVYGSTSVAVARRSRTAGDTHGHVEILGTDRRFHHFTSSANSIQARFGAGRRPLKYCLVKE